MGVRFQNQPGEEVSEIIIHIKMLDTEAVQEQETVGIVGVNLTYGAFYLYEDPRALTSSLLDGLSRRRIEIDMIRFAGPAFASVDNRLMSPELVEHALTDAVLFTPDGEVVQPTEVLYGRPVLIERGSFRPITNVTLAARVKSTETSGLENVLALQSTHGDGHPQEPTETREPLVRRRTRHGSRPSVLYTS
jgi:hypothetical protein